MSDVQARILFNLRTSTSLTPQLLELSIPSPASSFIPGPGVILAANKMARFIDRIVHMRNMPNAEYGRQLLQRIVILAEPIMDRHGFTIGELLEFYPPDQKPNCKHYPKVLLGQNTGKGRRVELRLRHHRNPHRFLSEDEIMDTLLHELTHNVYGPHGHRFHGTWNSLRDEWKELRRRGWGQNQMYGDAGYGGQEHTFWRVMG
jgi:hypothetical protein